MFSRNNLKITHPSQLKFTTESDLVELGMSKPEMRRLRKYYEKHFPNNYLSKIRKFITARKQDSGAHDSGLLIPTESVPISRMSRVSSKHIIPAASITVNKELGMGEFGVVQQGVWCNEGERIQVLMRVQGFHFKELCCLVYFIFDLVKNSCMYLILVSVKKRFIAS